MLFLIVLKSRALNRLFFKKYFKNWFQEHYFITCIWSTGLQLLFRGSTTYFNMTMDFPAKIYSLQSTIETLEKGVKFVQS